MRQIDRDEVQPLGDLVKREEPKPEPKPQPVPGRPGIVRGPDGKLQTDIPGNEAANYIHVVPYWWRSVVPDRW